MKTLKGHGQGPERQSVWTYIRGHRLLVAVPSVALLAAVAVIPYVSASSHDEAASIRSQQASDSQSQSKNRLDSPKEPAMSETDETPSTNHSSSQTSVTVNGQSVDVPANGSYHNVSQDANGRTEVTVQSSQSSSGDASHNSSSSSVNLDVNSQSSSSNSDD
jgi:hypothetical protein